MVGSDTDGLVEDLCETPREQGPPGCLDLTPRSQGSCTLVSEVPLAKEYLPPLEKLENRGIYRQDRRIKSLPAGGHDHGLLRIPGMGEDQKDKLHLDRQTSDTPSEYSASAPHRAASKMSNLHMVRSVTIAVQEAAVKVDPLSCTVSTMGAVMAFSAGMANVVTFYALGFFVSHATGNLAKTGLRMKEGNIGDLAEIFFLIVSFMVGSGICGCLISRGNVSFSNGLYGVALVGNAFLLVIAVILAPSVVAPYIVAAACGLQNGVATSYSGAVIRVTHATGLATDIGLLTGRAIFIFVGRLLGQPRPPPEKDIEHRKLVLLVVLFLSFLLGAVLGALLHGPLGVHALLLPAALNGIPGAIYSLYRLNEHYEVRAKENQRERRVTKVAVAPGKNSHADVGPDEANFSTDSRRPGRPGELLRGSASFADGLQNNKMERLDTIESCEPIEEENTYDLRDESSQRRTLAAKEALSSLEKLQPSLLLATTSFSEAEAPATKHAAEAAMEAHRRYKEALMELTRTIPASCENLV
mmetsp:Transcript_19583/g.51923  ORF Transcript_19583/g.51923 Transcript_19583/m.51923 type:complete len:527 (+) Transcript_19583:94-1674(+)